nr:unnamed protein product [Naegleria fowleri]
MDHFPSNHHHHNIHHEDFSQQQLDNNNTTTITEEGNELLDSWSELQFEWNSHPEESSSHNSCTTCDVGDSEHVASILTCGTTSTTSTTFTTTCITSPPPLSNDKSLSTSSSTLSLLPSQKFAISFYNFLIENFHRLKMMILNIFSQHASFQISLPPNMRHYSTEEKDTNEEEVVHQQPQSLPQKK